MDKTLHLLIMYTMLVLMLLLLQKGRKDRKSLYLALYAIVEVLTNAVDSLHIWGSTNGYKWFLLLPFLAKPLILLWVPFFYFYVRTCFSDKFVLRKRHLLHLLPFAIMMSTYLFLLVAKGGKEIVPMLFDFKFFESYSLYYIDIALKIQYIIYNTYLILLLSKIEKKRKQNENIPDLNVNIKWLRFIVYGYAVACFGAILTFALFHINTNIGSKVNIVSILYFFIFFFIIFYDTIAPKSFSSIIKAKQAQPTEPELRNVLAHLNTVLKSNPLYLDPDLSLKQVAEALNEKERSISQAINSIEDRNFKDFINELRIKHAIEQLSTQKEKPIFEVMFESGFNSKGPFISAFKKHTGKTPSEFRSSLE